MTEDEHWEYIRKCLNEPQGADSYYPVSIYSLEPPDTAWLLKRMLARDDVLWMLEQHDADIARVRELEAELAALLKLEALHRSVERKRIAELEAQAALDAGVREAGKDWLMADWNAHRPSLTREAREGAFQVRIEKRCAFADALAARDATQTKEK